MSGNGKPVNVLILGKEYLIACRDEEREQLHSAVSFLNRKLSEMKDSGRVIGSERIAVMTALNISNELLAYKRNNEDYTTTVDDTVRRLQDKIDQALVGGRQLEMNGQGA